MKAHLSTPARGFTLVELLVVIGIVAMLAAAVLVLTNVVGERGSETRAKTDIRSLKTALDTYRSDGGKLEDGNGNVASSHALYCMVSGDYDEDGIPDKDKKTGKDRKMYCTSLVIIDETDSAPAEGIPVMKSQMKLPGVGPTRKEKKATRYVIIDPWGNPYRYRLGFEQKDSQKKSGKGNNPDFDIFSQGPDGLGNGLDNKGENEDNVCNVVFGR